MGTAQAGPCKAAIVTKETSSMTTSNPSRVVDNILARVLPVIREHLGEGEQLRRLPEATAEALISAGAFLAQVPEALGGFELPPAEVARLVEEVSKVDAAPASSSATSTARHTRCWRCRRPACARSSPIAAPVIVGGAFPPAQAAVVP
ncbi:MAG: hypothetical protein HC863_01065, partial [Myxococcales bacterium]|nr:hypothetical protein [Myxococcales bacterium]